MDVGGEKFAEITSPVGGQQPGCSKRNGFSYSFGFPKSQSSVDGIDRVRTLRFSKVVGKASNEIASLGASFIGPESLLHVEASNGVATQILNNLPKLYSSVEKRAVKSASNMLRCSLPTKFSPKRKCSKLPRIRKLGPRNESLSAIEKLVNERSIQSRLPQLN